MKYWIDRLKNQKIEFHGPIKRFGESEEVLTLSNPDGLELELVSHNSAEHATLSVWKEGPIPIECAIRGFYSVTLSEEGYERTAGVLTDDLGFRLIGQDGNRFRYQAIENKDGGDYDGVYQGSNIVDVLCLPYSQPGFMGIGTVHHIAWRTPTDEQQQLLRSKIIRAGLNATPIIDRIYFHSVYFREPGGILFEIATNSNDLKGTRDGQKAREKISSTTFLLLHGTGGNEEDLISLAYELDQSAAILSPRGKVLENGVAPRFFRRLTEGVFDVEDLKFRTMN